MIIREWRCSWSSADRRCPNYIWVIIKFIAHWGAAYIRGFTVLNHLSSVSIWRLNTLRAGQNLCLTLWKHIALSLVHYMCRWKCQELIQVCSKCVYRFAHLTPVLEFNGGGWVKMQERFFVCLFLFVSLFENSRHINRIAEKGICHHLNWCWPILPTTHTKD